MVLAAGKVFISITAVGATGALRSRIVSRFASNKDLVDACVASSNIPYLARAGLGPRFRGERVLDGGLTNNLPFFPRAGAGGPAAAAQAGAGAGGAHGNSEFVAVEGRRQLLFDLSKVRRDKPQTQ